MKNSNAILFELYETQSKNKKSRFGWRAKSGQNGKIIADSGEAYASKQGAAKGLDALLRGDPVVVQKWPKRIKLSENLRHWEKAK